MAHGLCQRLNLKPDGYPRKIVIWLMYVISFAWLIDLVYHGQYHSEFLRIVWEDDLEARLAILWDEVIGQIYLPQALFACSVPHIFTRTIELSSGGWPPPAVQELSDKKFFFLCKYIESSILFCEYLALTPYCRWEAFDRLDRLFDLLNTIADLIQPLEEQPKHHITVYKTVVTQMEVIHKFMEELRTAVKLPSDVPPDVEALLPQDWNRIIAGRYLQAKTSINNELLKYRQEIETGKPLMTAQAVMDTIYKVVNSFNLLPQLSSEQMDALRGGALQALAKLYNAKGRSLSTLLSQLTFITEELDGIVQPQRDAATSRANSATALDLYLLIRDAAHELAIKSGRSMPLSRNHAIIKFYETLQYNDGQAVTRRRLDHIKLGYAYYRFAMDLGWASNEMERYYRCATDSLAQVPFTLPPELQDYLC